MSGNSESSASEIYGKQEEQLTEQHSTEPSKLIFIKTKLFKAKRILIMKSLYSSVSMKRSKYIHNFVFFF